MFSARGSTSHAIRKARASALKHFRFDGGYFYLLSYRYVSHKRMVYETWKNSENKSTSKVPMRARVNGISMNKPGRPDKSTTTRDKASSNGA